MIPWRVQSPKACNNFFFHKAGTGAVVSILWPPLKREIPEVAYNLSLQILTKYLLRFLLRVLGFRCINDEEINHFMLFLSASVYLKNNPQIALHFADQRICAGMHRRT